MPAEPERFSVLFDNPSVEAMYALTPKEFEHFVAYVLRRAGYDVKVVGQHWLRGVDLEMRHPGRASIVGGVECKRFQPSDLVQAKVVTHVKGAAAVSRSGARPYVITTSDFHENAHKIAEAGAKRAYLINGSQLVRYIHYIHGSRYGDEDVIASLSPEFFADRTDTRTRGIGHTKILTIANNKGGVGKTTTAYYLGVEFARKGKHVLMIDLDGQGNLTERCIPKRVAALTTEGGHLSNIAHYFTGERTLRELIIASETTPGMSLIPSDPFLALRDLGGSGRPDVELRFVKDVQHLCTQHIASLGSVPDWIIIDTPPAMSVFTRSGLAAAEYILAPIRPRRASLAGTRNMLRTLSTMKALMGTDAAFMGVVITHWDDLKLSRDFEVADIQPVLLGTTGRMFAAKIPMDNQLESLEPGAKTRGAKAYEDLASEVLDYAQARSHNREHVGATSHVNARGRKE